MSILGRGGHLTEMQIDLVLLEEAPALVRDHLDLCESCRVRLEATRLDQDEPLPELVLPSLPVLPEETSTHLLWVFPAVAMALAAALMVYVRAPAPQEYIARGGGLSLDIVRDGSQGPELLVPGAEVHVGDRLGVRVTSGGGALLVFGQDEQGTPYAVFPQQPVSETIGAGAQDLPAAVQMDAVLGREQITAVLCPEPFHLDFGGLVLPAGCEVERVLLMKRP